MTRRDPVKGQTTLGSTEPVRPNDVIVDMGSQVDHNGGVDAQGEPEIGYADGEAGGSTGNVEDATDCVDQAKVMRRPYAPTKEEFEAHMANQLQFRSWCLRCVAGNAIAGYHKHDVDAHKAGMIFS